MISCPYLQSQSYYDYRFYRILGLTTTMGRRQKLNPPGALSINTFDKTFLKSESPEKDYPKKKVIDMILP